jgi:2',3'-cyclic-nucleotide 2'-phosphodiesterase (5'-nucleotidase family)
VARRATVINQEREQAGFLLVLDAGDSLTGDQPPAQSTLGRTSVTAMNMMGYDAMALGGQDLALSLPALRQRIAEAEFAILSANAVVSPTGEMVATSYLLHQFDGHTVAIVGLSEDSGTRDIAVRDPLVTAREIVAQLSTQADVIILLSHAGPLVDQQIAEAVPGIDLVISGGKFTSDSPWRSEKTGTLLLHADAASPGHAGRRIGIARLTFDQAGQLVDQSWQRLDLVPEVASDTTMLNWVREQLAP